MTLGLISSQQLMAADIETLVMPGEVVLSHADLEAECANCHKVFSKSKQSSLCLDCHKDIAGDVQEQRGFHGKSERVAEAICAACHSEHLGRDADIVQLVESSFDHDLTDFLLLGGHSDAECKTCHLPDQKRRDAPGECVDCHTEGDPHGGQLGTDCADCHNAKSWQEVEFDHDETDYPLVGKHQAAACTDCHIDNVFDSTPDDCFSCHAKDDVHKGLSGENCAGCHNPTAWDDTSFDHSRDTHFMLDGAHATLTCNDCHSDEPFSDKLDVACVSCHQDDDNHHGHFGADCASCHVSSEWESSVFDHAIDTDYALKGAHREVKCEDCHVEPIFKVALESGCTSCHMEDDVHEGSLGEECGTCHNDASWTESIRFDHDLTIFPLLGKHMDAQCDTCHESKVFSDAGTACADCHIEDDPHEKRFPGSCAACHNPVDWAIWFFDHDEQTDFLLDGAHVSVACDGCHRQEIEDMSKLGSRCGDCHRADDVHDREFGANCERCHSSTSFKDVRSLQ